MNFADEVAARKAMVRANHPLFDGPPLSMPEYVIQHHCHVDDHRGFTGKGGKPSSLQSDCTKIWGQ